jgi:hypothetical protein
MSHQFPFVPASIEFLTEDGDVMFSPLKFTLALFMLGTEDDSPDTEFWPRWSSVEAEECHSFILRSVQCKAILAVILPGNGSPHLNHERCL